MEHPDRLFLDFQSALAGRYSLEREVGRGGMGVVYLAREVRLDRPVAIKLLPPSKARDRGLLGRFPREGPTAAEPANPHTLPVFTVWGAGELMGGGPAARSASSAPTPAPDDSCTRGPKSRRTSPSK